MTATHPRLADGQADKNAAGRNALITTSDRDGRRISLAGTFAVFRTAFHVFTV